MSLAADNSVLASPVEQSHDALEIRQPFMAMVAHEMRNFLTPVAYAVALLAKEDSPATVDARQLIGRQVAQMKRLLDDLLDVAWGEQAQMTLRTATVDLRDVIADALDVARPTMMASRHHVVSAVDANGPVTVSGDRCRLCQVVSNLLLNAAKYTPESGEIQVLLESGSGCATVRVRDTGIGIDANTLPRIFDVYERARYEPDTRSGLGLGLSIARYLVEAHGGTLRAFSSGPGQGSEFVMRLPLIEGNLQPVLQS